MKQMHPFGAAMANEIFETHQWGYDEPCESDDYQKEYISDPEEWWQPDLPLENLRQLEERMRSQIQRFERCYQKMMVYALKWHYLTEEVEDNAQVEKMFNDMQMIRKLTGSDKA